MAEPRDDAVSTAYRALPGEGPPPALDAAIQAAARRAVEARPGGARRWQVPVSIAAVLALAIGVSLQVDREKPLVVDGTPVSTGSAEYPVPQAEPEREERTAAAPPASAPAKPAPAVAAREVAVTPAVTIPPAKQATPAPEEKRFAPDPPRAAAPAAEAPSPLARPAAPPATATLPQAIPPAPAPAPARVEAPAAAAGAAAPADAARAAPQAKRMKSEASADSATRENAATQAAEPPERRLERIAELRARGLHAEADRALAEFRRAFPDYRLSEEWLRKVERP